MLRDTKKWERIKTAKEYAGLRTMLDNSYREFCVDKDIPIIKFSDEKEYLQTGNRSHFEEKYFLRRKQLSVYALMSMIYPEKQEYIEALEDIICEICNEYTWVLPAHRSLAWQNKRYHIDLFSAETGLYLAEIKYMLIDRLNPLVVERITEELDKRIVQCFLNEKSYVEVMKSNWAAVCGASVGGVFIYENQRAFECEGVKHRIDACMEHYLEGCSDDGGTSEGADYWSYGFSYYVLYQDLMRQLTYGKVNGFNNPKTEKLAGFLTSLYLDEKNVAAFADGGSNSEPKYPLWTLHFLKNEYGIMLPPVSGAELSIWKFSWAVRSFLYFEPKYENEVLQPAVKHYELLEWYIERKKRYSFAVKGGHNKEQHNHNDIGSFIVTSGGKAVLCDLGAGEYTADYFGAKRYSFLHTSSLGHNVPIVNGHAQQEGKEYKGKLTVDGNVISIDMKQAYPVDIPKLTRNFELLDDKIVLRDSFDSELNIVERFVTRIKPEIKDNGDVLVGNTVLRCITQAEVKLEEDKTSKINTSSKWSTPDIIYLIDFHIKKDCELFEMHILPDGIN